jgi:lariat debranching enzyme
MHTLACPPKYRSMGDFYRYYTGELVAPYLTIFIGGNHEASTLLRDLYYGGWVAPNIYYLGAAGVINVIKGS